MDKYIDFLNDVYPLTLDDIRKYLYNVSLPKVPTTEQLKNFGFSLVHPSNRPSGFNVEEGKPRLVDGLYYQTWKVVDFEDVGLFKKELKRRIESTLKENNEKGFSFKGHFFSTSGNVDFTFTILEFILKRDLGVDDGVCLTDIDGVEVPLESADVLDFVRCFLHHKKAVITNYKTLLAEVDKCGSLDLCVELKRRLDAGGI